MKPAKIESLNTPKVDFRSYYRTYSICQAPSRNWTFQALFDGYMSIVPIYRSFFPPAFA